MYYSVIKPCDIANGPGCRTVLFVSGCTHHCKGCFQPQTWSFTYGTPFTEDTVEELLQDLSKSYVSGITLLGGEPFEPENQPELVQLLRRIRTELPTKTIWAFSGYTYEQLTGDSRANCGSLTEEYLSLLDVLVDGEFVEEKKNLNLRFRGSSNQRILDMPQTRAAGTPVLWDDGAMAGH